MGAKGDNVSGCRMNLPKVGNEFVESEKVYQSTFHEKWIRWARQILGCGKFRPIFHEKWDEHTMG